MKRTLWLSASARAIPAIALLPFLPVQGQFHPDYENPAVFQRGQVPPHATLMPYPNLQKALRGDRKSSPFHHSLNGTWKFHWAESPSTAPEGFQSGVLPAGEWDEIQVPSNWQMEGYGYPLFRNIGLPHPLDPPEVPDDFNPVGSYFRIFTLPAYWEGMQVFLHFEGVQSASYVWINGKEVGYNQGGMEPAEYDITGALKPGANSIAVKVLRYCDGSYLEDQDTWRLSGIYRDVYLMATPKLHIRDFYITTDLDKEYRDAALRLECEVANYGNRKSGPGVIRYSLYAAGNQHRPLGAGMIPLEPQRGGASQVVKGEMAVPDPEKWSAEYPNLYTLVMELQDGDGQTTEILSNPVGFREVEVIDQALCINGVAVKFNGVNSHMMHPGTGHAMDVQTMITDLHLMKRFNINCVRTSHYPPNVEYLDLANRLGVYIVDEAGDEAHAYTYLSGRPEWREQYLDRARKMVYRDRNNPSVVIWSAGNESGPGDNICALIEEGKRIDPSRPAWMYGGNRDEDPRTNPIRCEEIVGPRYLHPFRLEQRFGKSDDPRPSFMDEYIAATGNSLGGLDGYWELIRKYRRLTGGAIWDWISPGITMPVVTTPDDSPGHISCALFNRARLVEGPSGNALYLSGHDDWLEVYRDPALDIAGEALTISFHVKPEAYNGNAAFLTKGDYQYGIIQADADHLEFYLNTGEKRQLLGRLPDGWTGRWHHVVGIYDGKKLELYVDGHIIGTKACRGTILNSPYWVVLGKSAELRDDHRGYMCHATLDRLRVFDRVVSMGDLQQEPARLKEHARLWLDFESTLEKGAYYSIGIPGRTYGLVWPDRSVQPELWQLKRSPQPVAFEAVDPGSETPETRVSGQVILNSGAIRVTNLHHFTDLSELEFRWTVTRDGDAIEEGTMELDLPPGESAIITVPCRQTEPVPGAVDHLLISCHTREDRPWAEKGHEVAWEQFRLPGNWSPVTGTTAGAGDKSGRLDENAGMQVRETGEMLTITGDRFSYSFDKRTGYLSSMVVAGTELLKEGMGPRFNVWRAPLANDLDSWNGWHTEMGYTQEWMGKETANGWRSLGLDRLKHELDEFTGIEATGKVIVRVETSVHANNYTTGFKVHQRYQVDADGGICIETDVSPRGNLPRWIPKMGLQMELPEGFQQVEWFGRGPFETYPDRRTGARVGLYRSTVKEDYVPYIIPQDYGNRTDVYWIRLTDVSGTGLEVRGDLPFNASVQEFSTGHLDRAQHTFQLREEGVVTLNMDHRVSGVGGTANSVLNPYRVFPGETSFTFYIFPINGTKTSR